MKNTDLSIIIPTYNNEQYIARCLDSVLSQAQSEKFEIIVVNDGSTDGTAQVLSQYRIKYPNIVLIEQSNHGVSAARNRGINAAHGKYITFIDSDDMVGISTDEMARYFTPAKTYTKTYNNLMISNIAITAENIPAHLPFTRDYFTNMLAATRDAQPEVVLAGKITINADKGYMRRHIYTHDKIYDPSQESKDILLKHADVRETANFALYQKDFLQNNNLMFIPTIHLDEDILFCMQAILHATHVATVANASYLYNRHPDTLSNITNQIKSNAQYSYANIQRMSVLLATLKKFPQYAGIFTHWLKAFSAMGQQATSYQEGYPPSICYMCPDATCDKCFLLDVVDRRITQNIKMFIPEHTK